MLPRITPQCSEPSPNTESPQFQHRFFFSPAAFPGPPGTGSQAIPALTLAQGDGFPPVEVALGVLAAGGGAVSHQAVAGVTAEAHGAAGAQPRMAQDHPVSWRLGEAAVGSWERGQEKGNQSQDEQHQGHSLPNARSYTQKMGILNFPKKRELAMDKCRGVV